MAESILAELARDWQGPGAGRFLTTGDAARVLRMSAEGVRKLARQGVLACERTRSQVRLFRPDDVRALAYARAAAALVTVRPAILKPRPATPRQQQLFGVQLRMAKAFARRNRLRILNRKAR